MGLWEKLSAIFGKKKDGLGQDDGQAQYFRDDFAPAEKKPTKKTAKKDEETSEVEVTTKAKEKKKSDDSAKKPAKKPEASKKVTEEVMSEELKDDSPEVKSASTVKEGRATANGKFDIRKAKDGRYFFSLYASNGVVIAYSQIQSSVSAVNTGISSVITNAEKADIEDGTLKKPISLLCPKWEIYIDKAGEFRFRLYASNGQVVCHSSHGYSTKSGCKGGIESIRRFSKEARVDKSYLK